MYESLADKDTQLETKDEEIAILRLENATTTALDEDLPTPKHVRERISDLEVRITLQWYVDIVGKAIRTSSAPNWPSSCNRTTLLALVYFDGPIERVDVS